MRRPPGAGRVREAPLAAGVLDDVSGGRALVRALMVVAAGRLCQRASAAAKEAPQ